MRPRHFRDARRRSKGGTRSARSATERHATKAWQTVVDAHDVLSNEKSRSDVDRKASAEGAVNEQQHIRRGGFIRALQNMGKMAAVRRRGGRRSRCTSTVSGTIAGLGR